MGHLVWTSKWDPHCFVMMDHQAGSYSSKHVNHSKKQERGAFVCHTSFFNPLFIIIIQCHPIKLVSCFFWKLFWNTTSALFFSYQPKQILLMEGFVLHQRSCWLSLLQQQQHPHNSNRTPWPSPSLQDSPQQAQKHAFLGILTMSLIHYAWQPVKWCIRTTCKSQSVSATKGLRIGGGYPHPPTPYCCCWSSQVLFLFWQWSSVVKLLDQLALLHTGAKRSFCYWDNRSQPHLGIDFSFCFLIPLCHVLMWGRKKGRVRR